MNISFFERETKYQSQLEKLNNFFKKEMNVFTMLGKAVQARANLDLDYAKGALIIVKELERNISTVFNKQLKKGLVGICQDWRNMAEQKNKIANEFSHIAKVDIKKFTDNYRV
jgi:cytochrome c556